MSRCDSSNSRPYHRLAAMTWLSARFIWSGFHGPDFYDASAVGRRAVIAWLETRCRSMRAAAIAGAWHYDLPTHTVLKRILDAERAALEVAATESLPAPPSRRRLRAA
jgi:hypothetical protein